MSERRASEWGGWSVTSSPGAYWGRGVVEALHPSCLLLTSTHPLSISEWRNEKLLHGGWLCLMPRSSPPSVTTAVGPRSNSAGVTESNPSSDTPPGLLAAGIEQLAFCRLPEFARVVAPPLDGSTSWIKALTCFPLQRRRHRHRAHGLKPKQPGMMADQTAARHKDVTLNGAADGWVTADGDSVCAPTNRTVLRSEQNGQCINNEDYMLILGCTRSFVTSPSSSQRGQRLWRKEMKKRLDRKQGNFDTGLIRWHIKPLEVTEEEQPLENEATEDFLNRWRRPNTAKVWKFSSSGGYGSTTRERQQQHKTLPIFTKC